MTCMKCRGEATLVNARTRWSPKRYGGRAIKRKWTCLKCGYQFKTVFLVDLIAKMHKEHLAAKELANAPLSR